MNGFREIQNQYDIEFLKLYKNKLPGNSGVSFKDVQTANKNAKSKSTLKF